MKKHKNLIILIVVVFLIVLLAVTQKNPGKNKEFKKKKTSVKVLKEEIKASPKLIQQLRQVYEAILYWSELKNKKIDVIDSGYKEEEIITLVIRYEEDRESMANISYGTVIYLLSKYLEDIRQYQTEDMEFLDYKNKLISLLTDFKNVSDEVQVSIINKSRKNLYYKENQLIKPGQTYSVRVNDRQIGQNYEGSFKFNDYSFPYNVSDDSIVFPNNYKWSKISIKKYQLIIF